MGNLWFLPTLLGLALGANGIEALIRKRVFLLANRDPEGAIYRDYEPVFYWLLVGINFSVAIGSFVAAYYSRAA
jgi:hypothetical protein